MKHGETSTISLWASKIESLLRSAIDDINTCLHHYVDFIKSTPMTFLGLANMTKEGFPILDLFKNFDSSVKSTMDFKKSIPFFQMSRLMQVICNTTNNIIMHF